MGEETPSIPAASLTFPERDNIFEESRESRSGSPACARRHGGVPRARFLQ
jgi:hypothetical protein